MNNENLRVVLFISRNKDNKELKDFKPRTKSFLTGYTDPKDLYDRFSLFCDEGLPNEYCRFYWSVNKRDADKTQKDFMHWLIEHPDADLTNLDSKVASLAAKSSNKAESKWLFDIDNPSVEHLAKFVKAVPNSTELVLQRKTPNGWAVIANHGFDTRELLEQFPDVTLKRDDMLFILSTG